MHKLRAVSLGSIGIVAALAFSGVLDAKIAGTLLGAVEAYESGWQHGSSCWLY